MVNYGSNISEFVRRFRLEKEMTQESLGKMLGYKGAQIVCDIEKGLKKRPVTFCFKLMRKLDEKRAKHLDFLIEEMIENIYRERRSK